MTESKDPFLHVERNQTRTLNTSASRPDWLLYVVPSIAFVFGVLLFSLVCRTQRRREKAFHRVAALKTVMNTTSPGHTHMSQGPTGTVNSSKLQNSRETQGNLTKQEAQSYENVTAVIYSNEDKVNYCIRQDEDYVTPDAGPDEMTETNNTVYLQPPHHFTETDYVTPDAGPDEMTETNNTVYLQPPHHFTETDGESYENMEGCVYAHPRQPTLRNALSTEDDDYINPDEDDKHNLEQTDTESYENMAGSLCPDTATHTNTHTVDEGWYECMDRRQRSEKHT